MTEEDKVAIADPAAIRKLLTPSLGSSGIGAEVSAYSPSEADTAIRRLNQAICMGKLKRGEILLHIYRTKAFVNLGYELFSTYCQESLNISTRTAEYEMSVFAKMVESLNVPRPRLEAIDFYKLEAISRRSDQMTVDMWLRRAEDPNMSVRSLRKEIQIASGKAPFKERKEELNEFSLYFDDSQLEFVKTAMRTAGEISGSNNPADQLVMVCMEFANSELVKSAKAGTTTDGQLEYFIRSLERTFNVKLEVVNDV